MRYIILVLFLIVGGSLFGQDAPESYIWNYNSLAGKLGKKTQLFFSEKLHFNIEETLIDYKQTDLVLYHDFTKNVTLGVSLRNANSYKNDSWISEITPQFYAVYKTKLKDIDVNFSNRFDYRNFDDGSKQTRYRNKLTLISPVSLAKFGLRPYIAEEMFVKLNGGGFYNYRLFGGMYLFNIRFLKINLFYCYNRFEQTEKWTYQNVGGIYLNFNI